MLQVTHQLQYLPHADHVLVLDSGRIAARGSYAQLASQGFDFQRLTAQQAQQGESLLVCQMHACSHPAALSCSGVRFCIAAHDAG